jgi:eukaryotic-like serine/threonine-protein kinase
MAGTDSGSGALGKYRLIAELGHGGMAEVYLALASGPAGFNKLVVVKQIRQQFADDPDFLTMFLDEARLAARLNHPNVVQTNEVGEDGGRYFISMEYLEGQPLNRVLSKLGEGRGDPADRITRKMSLLILVDTLAGLHHAHELLDFDGRPLQVVHRDMSPHNVFVTYAGQVKIVDFGIAKALSSSAETRTGVLKGKIGYMAPEQALGEKVDRRADLFSVGMILWEMMTGKRMFKGVPDVAALQRIVNGDLPSPRSVDDTIPERIDAICMKALACDRDNRYATAAEMAADLEDAAAELEGRGSLRDVGKLIDKQFGAERARIKQLVEASHASVRDEQTADERRSNPTGSFRKPRLPVIDTPPTESALGLPPPDLDAPSSATAPEPQATPADRSSPSSLTANTTTGPTLTSAGVIEPPPPRSRLTLIAVGLVAAAALAVFVVLNQGGSTQPTAASTAAPSGEPSASPVARPGAHTLRIESTPSGATVTEGATVLGKTPLEMVLDPASGPRRLVISRDGYVPSVVDQAPVQENVRVLIPLVPVGASTAEPAASASAKAKPHRPSGGGRPGPKPPSDINMNR